MDKAIQHETDRAKKSLAAKARLPNCAAEKRTNKKADIWRPFLYRFSWHREGSAETPLCNCALHADAPKDNQLYPDEAGSRIAPGHAVEPDRDKGRFIAEEIEHFSGWLNLPLRCYELSERGEATFTLRKVGESPPAICDMRSAVGIYWETACF